MVDFKTSSKDATHRLVSRKRKDYDSRLVDMMDGNIFLFYSMHRTMKVNISENNELIIRYKFKIYTEDQFKDYLANHNYFNKRLTERFIYTDPEN